MAKSRAGCWVASSISFLAGLALALMGFMWAAFFSIGVRGGTTEEMIRYNLHDPLTAAFAYGPLALGVLLILAGIIGGIATPFLRRGSGPASSP